MVITGGVFVPVGAPLVAGGVAMTTMVVWWCARSRDVYDAK